MPTGRGPAAARKLGGGHAHRADRGDADAARLHVYETITPWVRLGTVLHALAEAFGD